MRIAATVFSAFTVISLVSYSATTVEAQGRSRGKAYSKRDVDRIIKRAEDHSDVFRKAIDRSLDHSRLDDTRTEDRINQQVKELEKALDELRREFDRRDSWMETRSNVEKVMRQADEVNALMRRMNFGNVIEKEWAQLRSELNTLAGIYNLRQLRQ